MTSPTSLPESRLENLYDAADMGGERTTRANVIRELIDEIRRLRDQGTSPEHSRTLPTVRLQSIYNSPDLGGATTLRARVIRELVDAVAALRGETAPQL